MTTYVTRTKSLTYDVGLSRKYNNDWTAQWCGVFCYGSSPYVVLEDLEIQLEKRAPGVDMAVRVHINGKPYSGNLRDL